MGQDEGLEEIGTMEALLSKMTRIISHLSLGNEGSNFVNRIVEEQGVDQDTVKYLQEISGNLETQMVATKPLPEKAVTSSDGNSAARSHVRLSMTVNSNTELERTLAEISRSGMMQQLDEWNIKTLDMTGKSLTENCY